MKNCIFITVFNNENYVNMLYLLLESIFIFGNINEHTDILIYTSDQFMNLIKKSHLFNDRIRFEINNNSDNIDKACKARLDLFHLKSAENYDKILYLDTDILVKGDVNNIFDLAVEDILYTLQEGSIDDGFDYWGKTLFKDEINLYDDKSAFTSGIMLFKNCANIRNLFENIISHMIESPGNFHDQPYIVYNAFKHRCFDNKILCSYAINNDNNIHSDKIIHHFPGGPGVYSHKLTIMTKFLNELKEYIIISNITKTKEYININLLPIINEYGEKLEGNIFMLHHATEYTNIFADKAKNISNVVLNIHIKQVVEIGFNAGFSALLMLMSNPRLCLTCLDLGEHKYTQPCFEKLKDTYGDRINLVIGDSKDTFKEIQNKFDLIHIDGGHSTDAAESDIINAYRVSKQGSIIIMDDYDFPNLCELWNKYIHIYDLQNLHIHLYDSPHHSIKYVSNE
jgi:lipopolysaccharide biosynthesis glycosyltransferase